MKVEKKSEVEIGLEDLVNVLFGPASKKCKSYIRVGQFLRARGNLRIAKLISLRLQSYGIYISHKSIIHKSVKVPHPTGLVIGKGVVVEENVTIFQGTTIGGARIGDNLSSNYPTIGAGTVIFAGAVIVGNIRVGKNCVVGANSVVLSNIPDNSVCVGAPARVVTKTKSNYIERTQ